VITWPGDFISDEMVLQGMRENIATAKASRRKTIDRIGRWLAALNYACSAGDVSASDRDWIVRQCVEDQPGGWESDEAWVQYVEWVVKAAGVDPARHRFHGFGG